VLSCRCELSDPETKGIEPQVLLDSLDDSGKKSLEGPAGRLPSYLPLYGRAPVARHTVRSVLPRFWAWGTTVQFC
jgi:hypothetical protein